MKEQSVSYKYFTADYETEHTDLVEVASFGVNYLVLTIYDLTLPLSHYVHYALVLKLVQLIY